MNYTEQKDIPCAVCGTSVIDSRFLACRDCNVPVHKDCWMLVEHCPVFGCTSSTGIDPAILIYRRDKEAMNSTGSTELVVQSSLPTDRLGNDVARLERLRERLLEVQKRRRPYDVGLIASTLLGTLGFIVSLATLPMTAIPAFCLMMFGVLYFATKADAVGPRPMTIKREIERLELEQLDR